MCNAFWSLTCLRSLTAPSISQVGTCSPVSSLVEGFEDVLEAEEEIRRKVRGSAFPTHEASSANYYVTFMRLSHVHGSVSLAQNE
jgi:hypothetical protein